MAILKNGGSTSPVSPQPSPKYQPFASYSCSLPPMITTSLPQIFVRPILRFRSMRHYMCVPPGLPSRDAAGNGLVVLLRRSLYGLRQAGRQWFHLFTSTLCLRLWFSTISNSYLSFYISDPPRYSGSFYGLTTVLCPRLQRHFFSTL